MWALPVIGLIVIAGLVYLGTLDGNYTVRQSKVIDVSPELVFNKLKDFRSWVEWSPWVMHEPDCKIQYSDKPDEEGGYYTWDGKVIGAGKLTHLSLVPNKSLHEKLEFTRPFKSVCDVGFELEPEGDGTRVSWIMKGKMPFLFRFMVPKTVKMINQDYELGLARLNGVLDSAGEYPKFAFDGLQEFACHRAICKSFEGSRETIPGLVAARFTELSEVLVANEAMTTEPPFSAYNTSDADQNWYEGDVAVPVEDMAEQVNLNGCQIKEFATSYCYRVTLTGSYKFLGMARHAATSHLMMTKQKVNKSGVYFERYLNSPGDVSHSNELVTELYVPMKS